MAENRESTKLQKYKWILIALPLIFIGWWARVPLGDFFLWISNREAVSEYIAGFGNWGWVVYAGLLILQLIVAFLPGQALVFAAGYVFGFLPTLLITIPVAVIGSQIAFYLARRYGKPIAYRLATQKTIDRWERISHAQGITFYFLAFNLPIFPSDAMCYVAGLATISGARFFVANLLGRSVSTLFTVSVGAFGLDLPGWFWILAVLVILLLYFGWAYYARKNNIKVEKEN